LGKQKEATVHSLEMDVIDVWGKINTLSNRKNRYTAFLLQKQIDEIVEDKFTTEVMDKELADMILIIFQYFSCQNKSSEKYILERLNNRHVGKTEQIKKKYYKLYRNYKFPTYSESKTP
jgi:predicted house-cleaning noncanonical NTP pyrophosphatase (MazG superfamily)